MVTDRHEVGTDNMGEHCEWLRAEREKRTKLSGIFTTDNNERAPKTPQKSQDSCNNSANVEMRVSSGNITSHTRVTNERDNHI
jgi:hypothetical protein